MTSERVVLRQDPSHKKTLQMPGYQRTQHPIYSFSVWGKRQREFVGLTNKTSWGLDSPFGLSVSLDAKNLFLGLDYSSGFTFDHHAEEIVEVEYRWQKSFSGQYIDQDGHSEHREYTMFVRDLERTAGTQIAPEFKGKLQAAGAYIGYDVADWPVSLIRLKPAVGLMVKDLQNERQFIKIEYC